jgi:superfamily II DNA or RNA helicase
MDFSIKDIEEATDIDTFRRGLDYARAGKVVSITAYKNNALKSEVRGTTPRPYRQTIEMKNKGIYGECSCPVGWNCKHVIAALIAMVLDPKKYQTAVNDSPVIGQEVMSWLDTVENVLNEEKNAKPKTETRLVYILNLDSKTKSMVVTVGTAVTLRDGARRIFKSFKLSNITNHAVTDTMESADIYILQHLKLHSPYDYSVDSPVLEGKEGATLLEDMLKTGALYWQEFSDSPLMPAPEKTGSLAWKLNADGTQSLTAMVKENPASVVLPLSPVFYIDADKKQLGQLKIEGTPAIIEMLLKSPPIPEKDFVHVSEKLARLGHGIAVPAAVKGRHKKQKTIKPVPRLFLHVLDVAELYAPEMPTEEAFLPVATLSFDYEGTIVPWEAAKLLSPIIQARDNALVEIPRNAKMEAEYALEMAGYDFETLLEYQSTAIETGDRKPQHFFMADSAGKDSFKGEIVTRWLSFVSRAADELRMAGWVVEVAPDFPFTSVELEGDWDVKLEEGTGIDWFGMSLSATADGKQVDMLPVLLNLIKNMGDEQYNRYMEMPPEKTLSFASGEKGVYWSIPAGRVKNILRAFRDLWNGGQLNINKDGTLRLSRLNAALLADMEAATESAQLRWFGGEKIRALGQKLRDFREVAVIAPPVTLQATLRPYQQEGLNWLAFLKDYGFGGILADDMGLGKTIQALAWIMHEKQMGNMKKPVLVIAPTSLMHNWKQEAHKFTPSLKTLILQGQDRKNFFDEIVNHDLVMTTYPLLPRDKDILLAHDFHAVILDEAQFIKNSKARMTQIVQQLKAEHRLCLTGTPLENHLGELWSLFNFLQPGLLGDEAQFKSQYRRPIEKEANSPRRESLARRIRPFILRRTKEQVAPELPAKTEIIQTAVMEPKQRDLYETIRLSMHEKVRAEIAAKGLGRSHIIVLDALLKLRQVCCDPRLLKLGAATKVTESAKLEMLMEMLPEMLEEGRRVLLFSQFTEMLALIEAACKERDIPYVKLTGQTKDRQTPIEEFQSCKVPLFLISLKAGGTGLNLTAADTVIHYDPWWNPAVERQATDRAHRIGQDKPVFVYKFIMAGTVEEKILELQLRKQALADSLFDPDKAGQAKLTEHDIAALFEPLEGD